MYLYFISMYQINICVGVSNLLVVGSHSDCLHGNIFILVHNYIICISVSGKRITKNRIKYVLIDKTRCKIRTYAAYNSSYPIVFLFNHLRKRNSPIATPITIKSMVTNDVAATIPKISKYINGKRIRKTSTYEL